MKEFNMEAGLGSTFAEASKIAKDIAINKGVISIFDFNGIICRVDADTNLDWLRRDYSNAWIMGWKVIGESCVEEYDDETKVEYKRLKEAQEKEAAIETENYRKKQKEEKEAFEIKVDGVSIEIVDLDIWNKSRENNQDSYGRCTLDYAEGWAKLMQLEIANGKSVSDCAKSTSFELGFLGVSGFMYCYAVSILSQCWKYGDELKEWNNKK